MFLRLYCGEFLSEKFFQEIANTVLTKRRFLSYILGGFFQKSNHALVIQARSVSLVCGIKKRRSKNIFKSERKDRRQNAIF